MASLKPHHHVGGKLDPKSNWGFYVSYKGRFLFQHFAQLYAAKHFINLMVDGDNYKWLTPNTIQTDRGVKIRSEQPLGLEQAIEYEPTPDESDFRFPAPYDRMYFAFPRDHTWGAPIDPDFQEPKQQEPKPKQSKPKPRTPKPTGDLTTAADLAERFNTDAKNVRQALRKAGIPKPDHGWAWPTSEADDIAKTIKEHLK